MKRKGRESCHLNDLFKRTVMTPNTEKRINKLHRGQSWTSVFDPPKEPQTKTKLLPKIRSSSFDKPMKPQSKIK